MGAGGEELSRVRAVYSQYSASGKEHVWAQDHALHAERAQLIARALATVLHGRDPARARVLDLGCGQGRLRADLEVAGIRAQNHLGIDVSLDRLQTARSNGIGVSLASGDRLPFPDGCFDVVIAATVLSSIHDRRVLQGIAREVQRVLRPGGALVVYDMRLPSPANRTIRPVTDRRLARLFEGWDRTRRSCTLLPPLARIVARQPGRRYDLFAAIPFLRSHALTVLRPPGSAPRSSSDRARVGLVGPMLGRNAGHVTTQGEILADLFRREGWVVRETSSCIGRAARLVDTARTIWSWRGEVDVAVISVFSGPAFAMADVSSSLACRRGLSVVLWLHGGNLPEFAANHPRWVRRVMDRGDARVAPSGYLAQVGGPDNPVEVIPNIVDLRAIPHRDRGQGLVPELLWMRTFHSLYNPLMAVRAFEIIHRAHPEARMTMAGEPKGSESEVSEAIHRLGLGPAVRTPGFLDADAKVVAFSRHDIYLHTNDVDNAPVSLLEAAAAGLPIVATRVGGIPHLLEDEQTALLVDPGDAQAMAAAVQRLLTEPELASRLSRNGRRLALSSSWPEVRARWTRVFAAIDGREDLIDRDADGAPARPAPTPTPHRS